MKELNILDQLKECETILPKLLDNASIWRSLDIDYHPPRVERVYTSVGGQRLCLHVLHECEAKEALYHAHPWSSAMKIVEGVYDMAIGCEPERIPYDEDTETFLFEENVVPVATFELHEGSYYQMPYRRGWHYVSPMTKTVKSIMLIDKPWENPSKGIKKVDKKLHSLSEERKREILNEFKSLI